MHFTKDNHLTYSIGGREYGYRETIYDKYQVSVGKVDIERYTSSSWVEEQYRTAHLVRHNLGKDLVVMFSGGTDSEIVLRSFKHIGITPRVIFIKFKDDYNIQDLHTGLAVARDIGVDVEIIDFDIIDFYKSGQAFEFASQIHCRQMAYLSVYHHILKLGAPAVMGGELLLRRHVRLDSAGKWYYCFRENEDASAMRFSIKYNIPLVNEWFSYTPEMIAYYLGHQVTQSLIHNRFNCKLSSVSTKNMALKSFMPSVLDKKKTHGFEKLLGFNWEAYTVLYESHIKRYEHSLDGIYMEDLNKQLFGEEYACN